MKETRTVRLTLAALCAPLLLQAVALGKETTLLRLQLPANSLAKPFSGKVYLMTSKGQMRTVPAEPSWFQPEPFFSLEVRNWESGKELEVTGNWPGYPLAALKNLVPRGGGDFWVAAICDLNLGGRRFGASEGNLFSKPAKVSLHPDGKEPALLILDQVFHERPFPQNDQVRVAEMESPLLSKFHGRKVKLRAGVALPPGYKTNPDKRYPTVYEIPGFGGNHFAALSFPARGKTTLNGVEVVQIVLDPECPTGHHVFADSANNGPYGQALVREFIPYLEKEFRLISKPQARLVTGHSSGGWSSLWLQVNYPRDFGGVWSTAPDPVDFRDFQKVNVYEPQQNMYMDSMGKPRPLGRRGDTPFLFYKPFCELEEIMGRGGQLASFEAVFSPRGPDGKPRKLWDRKTGLVDPEIANTWKAYDIRLLIEKDWPNLEKVLAGKIHVYMGDKDTFYLEGATRLLGDSLKKLGSDARVELFPGKDHSSLMDAALRDRITREMADSLRKGLAKAGE